MRLGLSDQAQPQNAPAVLVGSPTGIVSVDQAAIAAAIAALPANGGTVQLGYGTYAVSSKARTLASITYAAGTWTVNTGSVSSADIGSYVLCPGLNGRVPKIATVNGGAGTFTTDIPPLGTVTAVVAWIVIPGVLLPEGVILQGVGNVLGGGTSNYFDSSGGTANSVTRILDSGTGITVLIRGSNSLGAYAQIEKLSLWGGNGALGTARGGLYIGNNEWFCKSVRVDFQFYTIFGAAGDFNQNNVLFDTCMAANIASTGTTQITGGFLMPFFGGQPCASYVFLNCFAWNLYGMGFGACTPGFAQIGMSSAQFLGCQSVNIFFTASSPLSGAAIDGTGYVLNGSAGPTALVGSYGTTNNRQDVYNQFGPVGISGGNFSSNPGGQAILNYGVLSLSGVYFQLSSGVCVTNNAGLGQGVTSYSGCASNGAALYTGGPNQAAMQGSGSSSSVRGSSVGIGAAAPTVAGSRSTAPPTNATIQTALGNLALNTDYQNTLSYDVRITVFLSVTVNTSGVVQLGVGPAANPTQTTIVTGVTTVGFLPVTFTIPAGYHAKLSITGTITDTIAGQYLEAA